jgi:hypothetical protein
MTVGRRGSRRLFRATVPFFHQTYDDVRIAFARAAHGRTNTYIPRPPNYNPTTAQTEQISGTGVAVRWNASAFLPIGATSAPAAWWAKARVGLRGGGPERAPRPAPVCYGAGLAPVPVIVRTVCAGAFRFAQRRRPDHGALRR